MINSENPTRAEINDIYNCISDGADGLVLAAETAIGKYPIEAVKMIKNNIFNYKLNHKNEKIKLRRMLWSGSLTRCMSICAAFKISTAAASTQRGAY